MKLLAAAPLFASLGARSLAATLTTAASGLLPTQPRDWNNNIYTRFGVRPIINCRGVWTYITASVELPPGAQGRRRGLSLLRRLI